jgi:hypothetical protein
MAAMAAMTMTGTRLALLTAIAGIGCGAAAPMATVVAAGTGRCQPFTDESVEVRARFVAGAACVALVDADVTAISARPAVWRETEGGWRAVPMPAGDLENSGWVAAITDGRSIFGVIDTRVEAPGWEALVLRSGDGGATWAGPVVLRKPYYMATVSGLTHATGGLVVLELELTDDLGSGVPTGRYRAESRDDGATWSGFARVRPAPR